MDRRRPANWHPRPGAPAPGPAVVFDLDGVISDASHRQPLLRGPALDWEGFFAAAVDDPPIPAGVGLTGATAADHAAVILTARPSWLAAPTLDWLAANRVRCHLLILRPPEDRRPAASFKRHELGRLRAAGYEIAAAIDDDERIVAMYRAEGVLALYVHSGYYER